MPVPQHECLNEMDTLSGLETLTPAAYLNSINSFIMYVITDLIPS
jgi:hypothetical protein